jgi:hypothetical protein
MRETFITWNPRGESLALVEQANAICRTYQRDGYDLTLRQLYYQFVARDVIPNNFRSYKRLGGIVDQARLAGLLDWSYIVDRTRNAYGTDGHSLSPEDTIAGAALGYQLPHWTAQPSHVEVWVEKEALAGVVQRAAEEVGVVFFSCRGYVSQSEMYSAGKRFAAYGRQGKRNYVVHLGDHDPSGIDMTRDITDRLRTFAGPHAPEVRRIALNMDQVDEYQPPPNFAKVTDSRFADYQSIYGDDSWELDALEPSILNDLITAEVYGLRDEDLWAEVEERQEEERAQLQRVSDRWDEVVELVG